MSDISVNERSKRHAEARRLAVLGVKVFPCEVGGKKPASAHGFKDATTDPATIDRWWSEADYNIGMCPHDVGLCVVDLDGQEGLDNWRALIKDKPVRTRTTRTPHGFHLYFKGELPPTVGTKDRGIAPKIDTRGRGSYVLLPPSVIDGIEYKTQVEAEPPALPQWIADKCRIKIDRLKAAVEELDAPANVERAQALLATYIKTGDVAIEGRGGNTRTYRLACELLNFGLSAERGQEILEVPGGWNAACVPPWSPEELAELFEHAGAHAQNEPGCWGVKPAAETFTGETLEKLKAASPPEPERVNAESDGAKRPGRFVARRRGEYRNRKPAPLLVPALHMPASGVGMLSGETGSLKSFLAFGLAASIAAGRPAFGRMPITLDGTVIYAAGEGVRGIEDQRVPAWEQDASLDLADFPFLTIGALPVATLGSELEEFWSAIDTAVAETKKPLRLVVLDTLNKMMPGLDENNAGVMAGTLRVAEAIVLRHGCFVLILHHFGHDKERERGSSAIRPALDWAAVIRATKDKARELYLAEVEIVKDKDGDGEGKRFPFRADKVEPSLVMHAVEGAGYQTQRATVAPKVPDGAMAFKREVVRLLFIARDARNPRVDCPTLAQGLIPRDAPDRERLVENADRKLRRYVIGTKRKAGPLADLVELDAQAEPIKPYVFVLPDRGYEDMRPIDEPAIDDITGPRMAAE